MSSRTSLFLNHLGIKMDSRKAKGMRFSFDLEQTMMGAKALEAQIADGTARVEGDVSILKKLAATMVEFQAETTPS